MLNANTSASSTYIAERDQKGCDNPSYDGGVHPTKERNLNVQGNLRRSLVVVLLVRDQQPNDHRDQGVEQRKDDGVEDRGHPEPTQLQNER